MRRARHLDGDGPFATGEVRLEATEAVVLPAPAVGVVVALDEVLAVVLLVGLARAPAPVPAVEAELVGAVTLRVRTVRAAAGVVLTALEARVVARPGRPLR